MPNEKVLLGLSGGADSTYAVARLRKKGYFVEGAVLRMHEYTDIDAARLSAAELGIPLHEIDCREQFSRIVMQNFAEEYKKARTPNPCIVCNREIKFKYLCEYAKEHGFDRIATGHYARICAIETESGVRYAVQRAKDVKKDQTYMLYRLTQEELGMLLFPLADSEKAEVREYLERAGLSAAKKGDSQEICFIPDGDYASFVEKRAGKTPRGSFIDRNGTVIGTHEGIIHYTLGQRKGLGISLGERAFVTEINPYTDTVTLDTAPKYSSTVYISDIIFSGMPEPQEPLRRSVKVKLRYAALPVETEALLFPDGHGILTLSVPQKAVTPGQSAVLYDGEIVVAGGFIDASE